MARVRCWEITPHLDSRYDHCIVPVRCEADHRKAVEYAKTVLEGLWDASAMDETLKVAVMMETIYITDYALADIGGLHT